MEEVSSPSVDQGNVGGGNDDLFLCCFAALLAVDCDVDLAALIEVAGGEERGPLFEGFFAGEGMPDLIGALGEVFGHHEGWHVVLALEGYGQEGAHFNLLLAH